MKNPPVAPPPPRSWIRKELPLAYLASVLVTVALRQLSLVNPFFRDYLHTLVGAMFIFIPMVLLLPRGESFDDYGLPPKPWLPEVLYALGVALVIFPPFWIGFRIWWGWDRPFHFVLAPGFWNAALVNLVVVALPEEIFYRGYFMGRLQILWEDRFRSPLVRDGVIILVTAVAFALGHWLVIVDPQRLAVFFPALVFGWLRLRRGSITAAIVFHALCNIFMDILLPSYGLVDPNEYFH